ncbi:hypothetical protein D869_gp169 [Caulobacter phage CcrRogue]|uniref:Uncharacterized protein n=1 Tax=Caulobacter phage CcrRogue TaxID=2927986 RepID=K4JR29_9CAUD|nr:hypothetical protein D869_gp169 [Caulobacter phage CcrRogue]AFU86745.1 hypothetical protein CcrRogue_gp263 [Caulobacter phage CcrRogue]
MTDIFDEVERRLNRKRPTFWLHRIAIVIIVVIGLLVVAGAAIQVFNPTLATQWQARQDAAYDRAYEEARRRGE